MAKVKASKLPQQSLLNERVVGDDFLDCYCVESTMPARQAAKIITAFPGWAQALLKIRTIIVAPFGLSTDGPDASDKLGIFPVETENSREVVVGFNDKHLDFRVSIFSQDGRVYLSTWVHTHNLGGRAYLKTILPFHVLIVRNALARVHDAAIEP